MFQRKLEPWYSAANGLKGGLDLGVEKRQEEMYNRHLGFVYSLKTSRSKVLKTPHHCIVSGRNAAFYSNIVGCMNQKAVMKKGYWGMRYNTTWKTVTVDAAAYMRDEDAKEKEWDRGMLPAHSAVHEALDYQDVIDDYDYYESTPLCVVIGMDGDKAGMLMIYKEERVWKALFKMCGDAAHARLPFLAKLVLKKLKIENVKMITGLCIPADSDPIKEAYKDVGMLFDGGQVFQKWKDN